MYEGRDEACPVSTRGGTRLVQLVREGRGGHGTEECLWCAPRHGTPFFLTPPRALRQVARRAAQRAAIAAARDTGEGPHAEIHNLHFLVMRKVLTFDRFWPRPPGFDQRRRPSSLTGLGF